MIALIRKLLVLILIMITTLIIIHVVRSKQIHPPQLPNQIPTQNSVGILILKNIP